MTQELDFISPAEGFEVGDAENSERFTALTVTTYGESGSVLAEHEITIDAARRFAHTLTTWADAADAATTRMHANGLSTAPGHGGELVR